MLNICVPSILNILLLGVESLVKKKGGSI